MIFYENLKKIGQFFNLSRNYNAYKAFDIIYKKYVLIIAKKMSIEKLIYTDLIKNIGYHFAYKFILFQYKRHIYITQKQKYIKSSGVKTIKCKYLVIDKKKIQKNKNNNNNIKTLKMYIEYRICRLIDNISILSPTYNINIHYLLLIYILTHKYTEIFTFFKGKYLCIKCNEIDDKKNTKIKISPNSTKKCKNCGNYLFMTSVQKQRSDEGPTLLTRCQNCTNNLIFS